jgi:DNA-binding response OmpR family regulator
MHRILVVEDDLDIADQVKWLLNEQGYITGCANQLAGLNEIINDFKPHLILMDILLPDGDGRDACKKIKLDPNTSHTPVIMFSSHPYVYDMVSATMANDIITKPFETHTFLQRISNQLSS